MAIEPLFELHFFQQIIDGNFEGLFDQAVDGNFPWPCLQRVHAREDALVHAEFVKIIILAVDLFRRDLAIKFKRLIAPRRIEAGRRVGFLRLRQCGQGAGSNSARTCAQKRAAVQKEGFGRGVTLGNFPTLAAKIMHHDLLLYSQRIHAPKKRDCKSRLAH